MPILKMKTVDLKNMDMPWEAPTDGKIISKELVDSSRWSLHYDMIFQFAEQVGTDQAYSVGYSMGATESQPERPWEDLDEVELTLVHLVERTIKVWEPV